MPQQPTHKETKQNPPIDKTPQIPNNTPMTNPTPTIFISAGEVSGDMHGAALALAIKKHCPEAKLIGIGGPRMRDAGVHIVGDMSRFSTIGILEPFKFIHKILGMYWVLRTWLLNRRPNVVVVIDNQGFHVPLLKELYKNRIPAVYYIAPQEWQWGTEEGGRKIAFLTTKILAIFKPESDFYTKVGANVAYVGHPLIDTVKPTQTKDEFCKTLELDPTRPIIGIFPGSRDQELRLTAPTWFEAAKQLQSLKPEIQFVVAIAAPHCESRIKVLVKKNHLKNITYTTQSADLIAHDTFSLATSGTITLEHAVLAKPCIVGYRFGTFSYWFLTTVFAKKVSRIKFMSLPNLMADKLVLPEYLQSKFTVPTIIKNVQEWLDPTNPNYAKVKADLHAVSAQLGEPGVLDRAAKEILELT